MLKILSEMPLRSAWQKISFRFPAEPCTLFNPHTILFQIRYGVLTYLFANVFYFYSQHTTEHQTTINWKHIICQDNHETDNNTDNSHIFNQARNAN